jgi:signal transduction histidine kinase/DNA-binding response OmpR family regulator
MAKILIVDDVPANREFLVALLGYGKHELSEASDGAQGLEQARLHQPALIIADIVMPTMDGFEFVRRLRGLPQIGATPVIFYTAAYYEHEARTLARDCGVEHIITKPSEPQIILNIVNEALGFPTIMPVSPPVQEFDREHLRLLTDKLSQKVSELEAVSLRLQALIEVGQQLASEHDPLHLLDVACAAAREIVGAKFAVLGLINEEGMELKQYTVQGLDPTVIAHMSLPEPRQGVIYEVISQNHAVRSRNEAGDPQALGLPQDHPPVYSFLCAPIASAARVYGWLGLRNKLGAEEFSADDEHIATSLAAQTAVAYENSQRLAEIQRHAADLEERVQARTVALQRSNAELEHFAYVASHDLQEPLRKVIGFTSLLSKRYSGRLDAEADEFMGFTVQAATRMQDLIQDLLTYSRVGRSEEMSLTDCERVLNEALANLQVEIETIGVRITREALPSVPGNERELIQLFQNLVGNGLKFRSDQPPEVHIGAQRQPDEWVFSVRDNGIGLDPQFADRIFLMFQRLHRKDEYPGTGIGLAICKKVVEHHGGRIWVESTPGAGATFFFTLPVVAP